MKGKLLFIATVIILGMNFYLKEKCNNVEYYDDHTISYKEQVPKYKDSDTIVLVVDNASETDILTAEKRSKKENAPIFRVQEDELDLNVMQQKRRKMYVYGVLDPFVEDLMREEGFKNLNVF